MSDLKPNHYVLYCNYNGSDELYGKILTAILGKVEDKTLIDLCSRGARISRKYPFKESTFVDIERVSEWDGDDRFHQLDVLSEHLIFENKYDVSYCSDGIEHFTQLDGDRLVRRMKTISDTQVIFTPFGPYCMDPANVGPHTHKSAWFPWSFPDFISVVCPVYHPTLHIGAFFSWKTPNLHEEYLRVSAELKQQNLITHVRNAEI